MLSVSEPWIQLGYRQGDWRARFARKSRGEEGHVLLHRRRIAGFALVRQAFLLGDYLELMVVAPEARARGFGGQLLAHVERLTFARARNLFVCVSTFNRGARRFYARAGYREVGRIPALLISGRTEILLRKTTGPARRRRRSSPAPDKPTAPAKTEQEG
jgi:ribosomal protein S18 acetylase RimI-like enzyme